LRGEGWPHERAGSRNRGEVVAENNPPVGRHEVPAIVEPHRRRGPGRIEREDAAADESAVKPIRHRIRAKRGDQQPRGIHRLAAGEREPREARRAEHGDERPDGNLADSIHHTVMHVCDEIEYALTFPQSKPRDSCEHLLS